jgi:hypothetical protein
MGQPGIIPTLAGIKRLKQVIIYDDSRMIRNSNFSYQVQKLAEIICFQTWQLILNNYETADYQSWGKRFWPFL